MIILKRNKYAAIVFIVALVSTSVSAKQLNVVTSFTVIADMVNQIGQDHVHVTSLVSVNGDPHTYEPTPADRKTLHDADIIFTNGLTLEGWMNSLVLASGYKNEIIVVSDGIKNRICEKNGRIALDPHAWNSMGNGKIYAKNIINSLIKADPDNSTDYKKQGGIYLKRLGKLDEWAKKIFKEIPTIKKNVLTSHGAFNYFGEAYGVKFHSPIGLSTQAETEANRIAEIINDVKKFNLKSYFIKNQENPVLVKQIASATGALPGGVLYPESLSDSDGPAPTYEAAFKHNVTTIASSMK